MGKVIFILGIVCLIVAVILLVAYVMVSHTTSKRVKKQLDEEYKGYMS